LWWTGTAFSIGWFALVRNGAGSVTARSGLLRHGAALAATGSGLLRIEAALPIDWLGLSRTGAALATSGPGLLRIEAAVSIGWLVLMQSTIGLTSMILLASMPLIIAAPHSVPGVMSRGATQHRTRCRSSTAQAASAHFLTFDE